MLSPDMFRYLSGLSALVLGQSFCGIATLVAAFDPDAAVTLAESPLPPDCVVIDQDGRHLLSRRVGNDEVTLSALPVANPA